MSKLKIIALIMLLISMSLPVYADELPNAFWSMNDNYNQAVSQKDYNAIITYATQIVNLIEKENETTQTVEIMGSRLLELALAYERLGDYRTAGEIHQKYLYYGEKLGWADGVKIAKSKILQYTPTIDLFTETTTPQKFYNQKNEQKLGVLYGATSDGSIRNNLPNESMILLYKVFGSTDEMGWIKKTMDEAKEKNIAVEFAWNFLEEGTTAKNVVNETDYIISVLTFLNNYPTVPVYLRLGGEMNIWNNKAVPGEFIAAFRHVSTLAKKYAQNVAMVWNVNYVSSWDVEMDDYYPGDEYVDWVGVSSYIQKYFLGRNDWNENELYNENVFLTGDSADPVKALNEVITKYGDRKPIMLAESGVSHYIRKSNEYCEDWALLNLKKMYNYVPMVYPQVKLIAYFDKVIEHEVNDYALSTNKNMADLYTQLVKLPTFLQKDSKTAIAYEKFNTTMDLDRKTIPISTYAHYYGVAIPKVNYYIDDVWQASSTEIPYTKNIDFSKFSVGTHKLSVVLENKDTSIYSKEYTINLRDSGITATKTSANVLVNGEKKVFNAYNINGNNYFKLRDIAYVLNGTKNQVSIGWENNAISIGSNSQYIPVGGEMDNNNDLSEKSAVISTSKIYFDGFEIKPIAYNIDGNNYFKLRDLGDNFKFTVGWDESSNTISITTK